MRSTGLVLTPTGRLDVDTCGRLRQQLAAAFASGITSVTVDLEEVTAIDTTGLGVLGGAAKHLTTHGGTFRLVGAQESVATSIRINGLGDLIDRRSRLRVVS
jgi:anti-sigma B factor antagonist